MTILPHPAIVVVKAYRLVEQTEAHVLVRLLLLLFLLSLLGRLLGGTGATSSRSSTSRGGTTRWDGGELALALGDQLCDLSVPIISCC